MRLLLACATLLSAAAAAAPAAAHDEYLWRHEQVRLTPAQAARVAELERRASAPGMSVAPSELAQAVAALGHCTLAERLMRDVTHPATSLMYALYPAAGGTDLACAGRAIERMAASARRLAREDFEIETLHAAGILWRRIGDEARARAAIEEAERLFDAEEALRGDRLWSCHGGNCITPRWAARLFGLRLLHGTPQWRTELERLAALAAPGLLPAPGSRGENFIGQEVYEQLVREAAAHGEEAIGLRLAAGTVHSEQGRSYFAARMHALLAEGRTAEALALLSRAGAAFESADPHLVAAHFAAFASVPGFSDRFRYRFDETSLGVIRALMERGAYDKARSLVALARSGYGTAGYRPSGYAAMEGLAAWLDDPGHAVQRLTAQARRYGPRSADGELAELGLFLASRGDRSGFEAAYGAVADRRVRARMLAELPCRASATGGEAAALLALRRAGRLGFAGGSSDDRSSYEGYVYQGFLCLLRRGHGDAAIAYAQAIAPVGLKLRISAGLPHWSTLRQLERIRRRLADLALEHVRRYDLWRERSVETVGAQFERLGDYRTVDEMLDRMEDSERRGSMLITLIQSYLPEPER